VPALLPTGWKDWKSLKPDEGQVEVCTINVFEDFVPFGIIGTPIARLHRTVGHEATNARVMHANAELLTLDHSVPGASATQVLAGFDFDNMELHWRMRSDHYNIEVLGRYLQEFEAHMPELPQTVGVLRSPLIISM